MRIDEKKFFEYDLRGLVLLIEYIIWLLLDPSKFKRFDKNKVKNVLIMHHGAVGELVVTTALIKVIKENINCKITLMIKRGGDKSRLESLFQNNPNVDSIIYYEGTFKYKVNKVRVGNYDLAIVTQASFYNSLVCFLAGVKFRVGGFSRIKRFPVWLYNRRIFPYGVKHSLQRSLDMLRSINLTINSPKTELYVTKKEMADMKKRLVKMKIKKFAVVHPVFGPAGKNKGPPRFWPSENYGEVADYIAKEYGLDVLITCPENEKHIVDSIVQKTTNKRKIHNMAGKTTLRDMIILAKLADLVIAPDTGISHATAALGTPLVNPMDAQIEEWAPVGDQSKIVNIRNPREIVLFENGKIYSKSGGLKTIEVSKVKEGIDKLLK